MKMYLEKDYETLTFSDEIKDVATYIQRISKFIEYRAQKNISVLYRGESKIYDTPCRPNIFRKNLLDSNKFFEKNLFDSMRQNQLTNDKHYLDNAIDAQHDEFPSRLLDLSYNSLTALYFAVTPYYHQPEDSLDGEDGMVFIFYIDEIYSPSAQNTKDTYNAIINKENWFSDQIIFQKNHKFIDHSKLNKRIIAQQGAFILFQGNDASDLPAYLTHGIKIPRDAKKTIRKELNTLFGIHTGTIYPESMNLVNDLSQKSKKINTEEFNRFNEINTAVINLDKELGYYVDYLVYRDKEKTEDFEKCICHVEKVINSYKIGLIEFIRFEMSVKRSDSENYKKYFENVINKYNEIVEQFRKRLKEFDIVFSSAENLLIKLGEDE